MKHLSIKLRMTLWYGLLMVLVVAVVLGFLLYVSESLAQTETRQRLQQMVGSNADEMEFDDGVLEIDDDFIAYSHGVYSLVYAQDKALLAGQLPPGVDMDVPFEDGQLRQIDAGGTIYYVYDQRIEYEGNPPLWIRGVMQADSANDTLWPFLRAGLITLPVLVILSAAVGYFITRRAFRPIEEIRQAAAEINDGRDLSRRIALGERRDELHRLAETFNRMLTRLEAAFEAEKQFVSDASHELRTPTAVILAQCEDALSQETTPEELREALEVVQRQAGRLSRLIAQLLDFTRLEQGIEAARMERMNISELLGTLCAEIEVLHPELHADIQPDVYAQADRDLFIRLASNLLQNAFRYGNPGGHAWITLRQEGQTAVLTVKDDGIGIAPEHLPKIWNRFYQVSPVRSGEESGNGLGLAMCKQITELHGGTLTASSEPGRGSEFRFAWAAC